MKIARIDFPDELIAALNDGKLVVFAVAGVSMSAVECWRKSSCSSITSHLSPIEARPHSKPHTAITDLQLN